MVTGGARLSPGVTIPGGHGGAHPAHHCCLRRARDLKPHLRLWPAGAPSRAPPAGFDRRAGGPDDHGLQPALAEHLADVIRHAGRAAQPEHAARGPEPGAVVASFVRAAPRHQPALGACAPARGSRTEAARRHHAAGAGSHRRVRAHGARESRLVIRQAGLPSEPRLAGTHHVCARDPHAESGQRRATSRICHAARLGTRRTWRAPGARPGYRLHRGPLGCDVAIPAVERIEQRAVHALARRDCGHV
mmetsp:Transcript_10246/g.42507  ORF Transcript_10246/g.42507 Transcript_10246/m.42507 type:complete len:247 (-) Transcript_10246:3724-4464(-)